MNHAFLTRSNHWNPFFPARIGASGTGRTTFVNTLCESEVLAHKISDNPDTSHVEEGIKIKPVNVGTSPCLVVVGMRTDSKIFL